MTFQHIPNPEPGESGPNPETSREEWNIWLALNGDFGPEAEEEANQIMDERIAEEDAALQEAERILKGKQGE